MVATATTFAACSRTPSPAALEPLPAVAGFTVGEVEHGQDFVRRAYTRGATKLSVTLARTHPTPDAYAQWVKLSADYPAARLPGESSGFYDCKGTGEAERCDLHAQFRSGYHIEIFAGGTATRADLDALTRGLPLEALSR